MRATIKANATHGTIEVERVGDAQCEIKIGHAMEMLSESELGDLVEAVTRIHTKIRGDRMRKDG